MRAFMVRLNVAIALLAATSVTGCASARGVPAPFPRPGERPAPPRSGTPPEPSPLAGHASGYAVTSTALALRGTPYRNSGADPSGFDCSGFVYYVFAQHGIAVPRTWPEFEQAARDLKAAAPDVRLSAFFTSSGPHFAGFAQQLGGQWFSTAGGHWSLDFTDPGTMRVAEFWQRLVDEDLVRPVPLNSQQWQAGINNGTIATYLDGAWAAAALMRSNPDGAGKWAVAPLPQWDPARPAVGVKGGSVFAITRDSKHPDAAMEFLRWMVTDPEAFRARLSSGTSSMYPAAPDLISVADEGFDRSYFNGQDIYALFRREAATIPQGWVWGPRMTATNEILEEGLARVTYGDTIAEALERAQEESLPDMRALGLAVGAR